MFPFVSQGRRKDWARRRQHESIEMGGRSRCGHGSTDGACEHRVGDGAGRAVVGTFRGDLK